MINFTIDDRALRRKLEGLPGRARIMIERAVSSVTLKLEARVKERLSGETLQVRSGNLRRSIHSVVESDSTSITGEVVSSGVAYARIQELGGKVHIPEIVPTKAQALHFMGADGKEVFTKHVRAHDVTIPARSYMRSSLEEQKQAIKDELTRAIREAIK
jgi:phage gpG-like protein